MAAVDGTSAEAAPASPRAAPSFRALLAATAASNLGMGISAVAYPWLVASLTRDPVPLVLVAVAAQLPWLLFALPVGALTDRIDCRRLMTAGHAARALLAVLLAALLLAGDLPLWLLYLHAFLLGTADVVSDSAAQTILPRLIPPDRLTAANGRLQLAEALGSGFVGPWLGGVLVGMTLAAAFGADAAMFALAALAVRAIAAGARSPRGDEAVRGGRRATLGTDLVEGFRYFWRHPTLRALGLFLALLNLTAGLTIATQVLFAQEILGLDARAYGLLFVVGSLGGLLGAQAAPLVERRFGGHRVPLLVLGGTAAAVTAIGLTSSTVVVGAGIAALAGLGLLWNVVTISYRQRVVPERLLGRVNSIYRLFAWGALPLGSLLGGVLVEVAGRTAREVGLRVPLLAAAALTAILFALAPRWFTAAAWSQQPEEPRSGGRRTG